MFMVVPSKANFNVLLGREWMHGVGPSTLHQRLAIWKDNGLVENIEGDQSYFFAEVNNITKKNFDK
jgi:Fe2+ or Zn2+ uptake regulation protein